MGGDWREQGRLPHTWKSTYIIRKWPSPCIGLTNLSHFVIRHRSCSRLWFAPSCVAASCYLPRSCWLFHSSHHLYALVLASHPSLIPLVIPSLVQARFPHSDRRSNSLSTTSSKRFHPPSPLSSPANDVPPSIIRLWCWLPRPAIVRIRQREGIMFEQFREWRNCVLRGSWSCQCASVFENLLRCSDLGADVISETLLWRCHPILFYSLEIIIPP